MLRILLSAVHRDGWKNRLDGSPSSSTGVTKTQSRCPERGRGTANLPLSVPHQGHQNLTLNMVPTPACKLDPVAVAFLIGLVVGCIAGLLL